MFTRFSTTGIGSLPHDDPEQACDLIFRYFDIPFWPQLPHRSKNELMVAQYSEGFPFVEVRGEDVVVREKIDEALVNQFYEKVASQDGFPISEDFAAGLHHFIKILSDGEHKYKILKGHITGPITFTLSIQDAERRPIFFDEEKRELALELLKGKAKWQIQTMKRFAEEILIFIDEPVLSALGTSTYISVKTDDVMRMLEDVVSYIKENNGIAGIHCCGRADWSMILGTGIDVFNFDSFSYGDSLLIYPKEVTAFLERGGYIAWGAVPTSEEIDSVDPGEISRRLSQIIHSLKGAGVPEDKLIAQSLLTPACGTGSLNIDQAIRVFEFLKLLRDSYVAE
jgi:hypothetical protein